MACIGLHQDPHAVFFHYLLPKLSFVTSINYQGCYEGNLEPTDAVYVTCTVISTLVARLVARLLLHVATNQASSYEVTLCPDLDLLQPFFGGRSTSAFSM